MLQNYRPFTNHCKPEFSHSYLAEGSIKIWLYTICIHTRDRAASVPKALNHFYAQFDVQNDMIVRNTTLPQWLDVVSDHGLCRCSYQHPSTYQHRNNISTAPLTLCALLPATSFLYQRSLQYHASMNLLSPSVYTFAVLSIIPMDS